jgi:FkbM family methyltransferase
MIILSKNVGPKGKVICLEPDSRLFLVLQELVILNKLKNVILYKKLFYHKNNKLVSFYENPLEDWMSNSLFNPKKKNRKHLVETITLDEIIKDNKLIHIDFAKFNIEGSEKYLTRGNVNFLQKCKNILSIFPLLYPEPPKASQTVHCLSTLFECCSSMMPSAC